MVRSHLDRQPMQDVQYSRRISGTSADPDNLANLGSVGARWRATARAWGLRLAGALPILALLALFIATGLRGVDFGYHWDEPEYHLAPARHMIESGVLLPKNYTYPTVDKWLVLLPAVPRGVRTAFEAGGEPAPIQAAMLAAIDTSDYLLRARSVFIVVSSLAILWTYGAARALRHRRGEALIAAGALGLSWQFAYHARWAVTDCILVQFSALTLFMLALFHRTGKPRWLDAAAIAAGLATGTKYTGVALLVTVLVAGALTLPRDAYVAQLRRAVRLCAISVCVYLLTTPGTLLEPFQFRTDTLFISRYYEHHSHGGYTVASAWEHVKIVASYLIFALFSPHQWLAALLFAGAIGGAVCWLKRDLRFSAVLVGFPFLFLISFCLRYRLVVVRNYLFVTPFFALMLARSISDLSRWLPRPTLRWLFAAGLIAVGIAHAAWLIDAGESIRHVDKDAYVRQALEYVRRHVETKFRVSNQVRASARAQHLPLPPNVVTGRAGTEVVFFGNAEGPGPWHWRVNDPWLTKAVFGPREVDFNWYSSWAGHDHLVVMTLDKARRTGVPLAL